jgi:hypothetical protein
MPRDHRPAAFGISLLLVFLIAAGAAAVDALRRLGG